MTPWAWHWKAEYDEAYAGEHTTRDEAIAEAVRELQPGDSFEIVEARMSEDRRHEGADVIPFLRTRNRERFVVIAARQALQQGEG